MQSTGRAASIDQKISGVSRSLNAKFLLALWRRGCHFGAACPPAWRQSMNMLTTTEMSAVLEGRQRHTASSEDLRAFRLRRPEVRQALLQLSLHVIEGAIRPRKDCLDGLPIPGEYGNSDAY